MLWLHGRAVSQHCGAFSHGGRRMRAVHCFNPPAVTGVPLAGDTGQQAHAQSNKCVPVQWAHQRSCSAVNSRPPATHVACCGVETSSTCSKRLATQLSAPDDPQQLPCGQGVGHSRLLALCQVCMRPHGHAELQHTLVRHLEHTRDCTHCDPQCLHRTPHICGNDRKRLCGCCRSGCACIRLLVHGILRCWPCQSRLLIHLQGTGIGCVMTPQHTSTSHAGLQDFIRRCRLP